MDSGWLGVFEREHNPSYAVKGLCALPVPCNDLQYLDKLMVVSQSGGILLPDGSLLNKTEP